MEKETSEQEVEKEGRGVTFQICERLNNSCFFSGIDSSFSGVFSSDVSFNLTLVCTV